MNIAFLYYCNKCCKWSVVPAGKDVDSCWSCKTPFVEHPISIASNIVLQDVLNGGSDLIEGVKEGAGQ